MNPDVVKQLSIHAYQIRKGAVTAVYSAKSGHPGGSLSVSDILTYLYFHEMNIDPQGPLCPLQGPLRARPLRHPGGAGIFFQGRAHWAAPLRAAAPGAS